MDLVTTQVSPVETFSQYGARAFSIDDTTGDLQVRTGRWVLVGGIESIRQDLQQHFRLFLGEWFLNQNKGVPYFQQIFSQKNAPFSLIESIFRAEALKVRGVLKVVQLHLSGPVGRIVYMDIIVETVSGTLSFTSTIEQPR